MAYGIKYCEEYKKAGKCATIFLPEIQKTSNKFDNY